MPWAVASAGLGKPRRKGCAGGLELHFALWFAFCLPCRGTSFKPHHKHSLSLGSTGPVGNPCRNQLKNQLDFGKTKPKAIILKWSKPNQHYIPCKLQFWPWIFDPNYSIRSKEKKFSFIHTGECIKNCQHFVCTLLLRLLPILTYIWHHLWIDTHFR